MAPKSVTFRRHDHLVSVLFGDLLSHFYNITFSMFLYLVITMIMPIVTLRYNYIYTTDIGVNWSMVGTDAEKINRNKPTMQLNLKGHSPALQESLVVHEFGHALGLEHEHQRSDFWSIVGRHLDKEKMMRDMKYPKSEEGKASFGQDWEQTTKSSQSEYDHLSIMHYR